MNSGYSPIVLVYVRLDLLPPSAEKEESYSNDVAPQLYERSMRAYSGSQRKGIMEERPETKSAHKRESQALQGPFFLAQATPLPPCARREVSFLARSTRRAFSAFWKR